MKQLLLLCVTLFSMVGCSPKQTRPPLELQSFSPVPVDMAKVDAKDYSELVTAVNAVYSPERSEYVDARLLKEEAMFVYVHVYSEVSTACFRVTVDRNRSRIVNMQPDCSVEME